MGWRTPTTAACPPGGPLSGLGSWAQVWYSRVSNSPRPRERIDSAACDVHGGVMALCVRNSRILTFPGPRSPAVHSRLSRVAVGLLVAGGEFESVATAPSCSVSAAAHTPFMRHGPYRVTRRIENRGQKQGKKKAWHLTPSQKLPFSKILMVSVIATAQISPHLCTFGTCSTLGPFAL